MAKNVQDKIKSKAKAAKAKVKGKLKGKKTAAAALLAAGLCALAGCLDTAPASRATTATYGDIIVKLGDRARDNKVTITLGDGALASADSSGSTETQTTTPTMDIKPDIDLRYNDAIAGATATSKGVLETLTDAGAQAVLKLMQSKETGTVQVVKTDGTTATVQCADGQCSFCEKQ